MWRTDTPCQRQLNTAALWRAFRECRRTPAPGERGHLSNHSFDFFNKGEEKKIRKEKLFTRHLFQINWPEMETHSGWSVFKRIQILSQQKTYLCMQTSATKTSLLGINSGCKNKPPLPLTNAVVPYSYPFPHGAVEDPSPITVVMPSVFLGSPWFPLSSPLRHKLLDCQGALWPILFSL